MDDSRIVIVGLWVLVLTTLGIGCAGPAAPACKGDSQKD